MSLTYDQLGNICTKSPLSGATINYQYTGPAGCSLHGSLGSPHQASYIAGVFYSYDANGNQTTNGNGRAISYNALNQVTQSVENNVTVAFQYGPDGDRFQRTDSDSGTLTYYIGKSEIRIYTGSLNVRRYIGGGAIDYVRATGSNETRYAFADHLGSMDVFASPTGQLLESESFDAHGNRRDPTTWQGTAPAPVSTAFGFTNQEHVDSQSFIHMNGRIYDPTLGRMLQADPVQNPGSQGLNRYAYVANNPLTLTDPSGYSWFGDLLKIAAVVVINYFSAGWASLYMGEGFIFGGSTLTGVAIMAGGGFISGAILTGNLQGAVAGAFTGALFAGIGQGFDSWDWAHAGGSIGATNLNTIGYSAKILAHGIAGGVMASLQGGKFGNGFWSAGVGEAVGPAVDNIDPENPVGKTVSAERIVAAAIVGGTTSMIGGGKFANGAVTAAMGRAFNEEATKMEKQKNEKVYRGYNWNEQETRAWLQDAYNSATAGPAQGLINIFENSIGPYDFQIDEARSLDTWTYGGVTMNAAQFGNFIAGFEGAAYDREYFYANMLTMRGATFAEDMVEAAGYVYHNFGGYDRLNRTGLPYIKFGEAAGWSFKGDEKKTGQ